MMDTDNQNLVRRLAAYGSLAALLVAASASAAVQQGAPIPPSPPPSLFAQHAQQAGLKACAAAYPALGAMVASGADYNVASSWNTEAPDAHPMQGLVGMTVGAPQYKGPAVGVVLATPTPGGCTGGAIRIVPFPQTCAVIAQQLPAGSKLVRDLSGTPLYQIGGNQGQVMLLSAQEGCVTISINRID